MTAFFSVQNLTFAYPRSGKVCDDLSFSLDEGDVGCLLGPSGCGKTTALRLIAGLEQPSIGKIVMAGRELASAHSMLSPEQRGVGVVFQDYALFPHMTIAKNIAFGLHQLSRADRDTRVNDMLSLVKLEGSAKLYPHELSGGQQQRVALARALAPKPRMLLLDEPFSNLDTELREQLSYEVRSILKSVGTTAIVVTHDQHEAFALADRIGVMRHGKLEQWDTPYSLYHEPSTRFVADFVGQGAFINGALNPQGLIDTAIGSLQPSHERGALAAGTTTATTPPGALTVLLRPDDILHDDESTISAEVVSKAFRGAEFLYTLKLASGEKILSLVPSHHNHAIGERIGIRLEVDHVVTFER
jgi:iron(III) transport system ATP-binding protein